MPLWFKFFLLVFSHSALANPSPLADNSPILNQHRPHENWDDPAPLDQARHRRTLSVDGQNLKVTGFDRVEIPHFEGDANHYKSIVAQLKKQGLGCTTVAVVGPEANLISPGASIRQAADERHRGPSR